MRKTFTYHTCLFMTTEVTIIKTYTVQHTGSDFTHLLSILKHNKLIYHFNWVGNLQWLKLLAWKVDDRGFEPHSGIQVSKKQKCFFPVYL